MENKINKIEQQELKNKEFLKKNRRQEHNKYNF